MNKNTRAALALTATFTAVTAMTAAPAGADENAGVGSGWVKQWNSRDFDIGWLVSGAMPGRPGNLHRLAASSDWGDGHIRVLLTDYRCPAGTSTPTNCAQVETGYADAYGVRPGSGVTYVGASGIDVSTSLEGPALRGPLRLRIRPTAPLQYTTYGHQELWETLRVEAGGRIGPVDLATTRIDTARLTRSTGYAWSGPGGPRTSAGGPQRQRLVGDWRESAAHWVRMGPMTGRPGNAHSGFVNATVALADPDNDPGARASVEWNDWQCPAGVRPPAFAVRPAPCTLLRTEHSRYAPLPATAAGPLGISQRGRVATTVVTPTSVTSSGRWLDVTYQPAGDTISEPVWPHEHFTTRTFVRSTVSGRVGGIDLATVERGGGHSTVTKWWRDQP